MKKFIINDPLGNIICKLPDNHCLFCEHCHDYFYDYSSGPYLFLCDLDNGGDYKNCDDFKEVKNDRRS